MVFNLMDPFIPARPAYSVYVHHNSACELSGIQRGPFYIETEFSYNFTRGTPTPRTDHYRFPDQVLFDPQPIQRIAFTPKGHVIKGVGVPPSCSPFLYASFTDPILYDNFDDPVFEYLGPDPCKWVYAGPPECAKAIQKDGALEISDQCKAASFVYESRKILRDQFDFFEVQFKVKNDATDGNSLLQIKVNANQAGSPWTTHCNISTATSPYIQVSCGQQSRKIATDTWHTVKIAIDQFGGKVNYYLNGEYMGVYAEPNIKLLSAFIPAIGIVHSGGQKLEGVFVRGARFQ